MLGDSSKNCETSFHVALSDTIGFNRRTFIPHRPGYPNTFLKLVARAKLLLLEVICAAFPGRVNTALAVRKSVLCVSARLTEDPPTIDVQMMIRGNWARTVTSTNLYLSIYRWVSGGHQCRTMHHPLSRRPPCSVVLPRWGSRWLCC